MGKFFSYMLGSALISILTVAGYHYVVTNPSEEKAQIEEVVAEEGPQVEDTFATNVSLRRINAPEAAPTDFHQAAEVTMPAVVHIKSVQTVTRRNIDPFYELFGLRPRQSNGRQQVSSGSGVILTPDGYIVTNNHVIADADELTVTLNDNRTYSATVIGTDPSTDLGLIKIEGEAFPHITIANSDQVRVGSWVLAVGNPFNLASTATAGIVSAIGRDLEIIKDRMAIESFIQTDAAVNPGNSGGALVNLNGQLIGVNTAIASPTGTYAGYAFAVPSNIVRKVVSDLKAYGSVQRAFMGIRYGTDLNGEIAAKRGLDITEGILVEEVVAGGGAKKAGIQQGDIVVEVDGIKTRSDGQMLERIGQHRPGDFVKVKVYRDQKYKTFDVQLTDTYGNTFIEAEKRNETLNRMGISLRDLSPEEKRELGIRKGVQIDRLYAGTVRKTTDLEEGFVILKVNGQEVDDRQGIIKTLESKEGIVEVVGFYPGYQRLFSFELRP